MTPEGLWSFKFIDNAKHYGGGVAVFYKNQVLGGNNGFTYIGDYLLKGDQIIINVNIRRFNDDVAAIYKDEFDLVVKGKYDDLEFIVTGAPKDSDDLLLAVQCTRQSDITY